MVSVAHVMLALDRWFTLRHIRGYLPDTSALRSVWFVGIHYNMSEETKKSDWHNGRTVIESLVNSSNLAPSKIQLGLNLKFQYILDALSL